MSNPFPDANYQQRFYRVYDDNGHPVILIADNISTILPLYAEKKPDSGFLPVSIKMQNEIAFTAFVHPDSALYPIVKPRGEL